MLGVAVGPVNQESKGLRGTRLQFNEKRTEELYIVRNLYRGQRLLRVTFCTLDRERERERETERTRVRTN